MGEMGIDEIKAMLPQRYPFLLVDRVLEYNVENQTIVARKNLTINEPFFQGHFPDAPIMPGVLQMEALAQTAGILMNKIGGVEGAIALFVGIDKAKFRRQLIPGDTLRMEVEVLRIKRNIIGTVSGKIYVDNELASSAELSFVYKK